LRAAAMAVTRALIAWSLLLRPVEAVIESLAQFKTQYRAAVFGKTLWSIRELNADIEGTPAPVGATQLELWSWLAHVSDGPQKAEAKALIEQTYKDQVGLTGGLQANFRTELARHYAANALLEDKYTKVYRLVLGPADEAGSLLALRNQYHSMTAAEQKDLQMALEQPMVDQWDTEWQAVPFHTTWASTAPLTWASKFDIIAGIMDPSRTPTSTVVGTNPGANNGEKQWKFFKELVNNADTRLINDFTHKMAKELAHYL